MAPSPELGQPKPKAPDKLDTKQCSIDGTNIETDTLKSSNATQQFENLGSWDDTELRKLLDEAITYKRPKDREHKSEIFKELLQTAEQEDNKARINCISNRIFCRSVRGSNRHTQGGSLQDLVETVKQDQLLESDCLIGSHSRRQHNSRQKKYSSVSTRQREGGSLPSNVNCNPYEDQFSNDFGKRGIKNEKPILVSGSVASRQDCINRADDSQLDGKVSHTVIEIGDGDIDETCHLLAHDSLAQDPHSSDEGTELNPMKKLPRLPMNYTTHQYLNLEMMSEVSRIDKTVQFSSLKSASKSTDNNAIQLNSSYPAVNSCIDSKSMSGLPMGPTQNSKFATYHHPQNIHLIEHKNTDENGNAVQTFNSTLQSSGQLAKHKEGKKKKTERNIKSTITAKEIKGNRGDDDIEELVSFIENNDTRKNGVISNSGSKAVLSLDKKGKKSNADNKKENSGNNKLKKYNSMENLKTTSKIEEENAQSENGRENGRENAVVLRHKQQMKKAAETKENVKQQQQQKRGERRSWGTEELTYLGETNSTKETNGRDNDPVRKAKDYQKSNRKKDEQTESHVSSDSISALNESAEFHVVTKRKKKKKQEDMRQNQCAGQRSHMHGRLSYPSSHNYSTNRDAYLTPFNANDNRRKSTSSVPPSEKSDNSDLDSVHSLPIESTTRTNNNVQQAPTSTGSNTQAASYAEIARISQQNKQGTLAASLDKWPTVSNGKNPESPDNSNVSTCSTLSAKSHSSVRGNKFFPESNEMPNAIHDVVLTNSSARTATSNGTASKAISYSQSLTEDKQQQKPFDVLSTNEEVIKRSTNSLSVAPSKIDVVVKTTSDTSLKNPLQKSKSVDNDSYVNMNIDHYPALEKTVKPQKQYQSMPAVQTNNVNANQISVANTSTKPTSKPTKSSPQSQSTSVVKSPDTSTTSSSKKTRSTSINIANQTSPKDKSQSDASPELAFNQIDQTKSVKSPKQQLADITFKNMIHTTSTTKKSINQRNTTPNRPAVIILDSNKYGHNASPLLFGDFNEDEVRQWDQDDSNQSFIMPTNHHYDQTNQSTVSHKKSLQPTTADTITNDKLLSPQSDLGYSSSHCIPESCDISTINSIVSVDQTLDVASNHMQTNVRSSSSCSNSIGQDQSNNNTEPKVDNNSCSSSVSSNHTTDEILSKHPLNVNNSDMQPGRDKMTLVCERELKIRYIEPPVSNVDSFNHDKLVNFIGLAWEDIKDGAEFYNGQ